MLCSFHICDTFTAAFLTFSISNISNISNGKHLEIKVDRKHPNDCARGSSSDIHDLRVQPDDRIPASQFGLKTFPSNPSREISSESFVVIFGEQISSEDAKIFL